ncbi:AAA family ATPase [Pseudomonas taetrolens]|uniref:AAA family ATPase n=1 Tax=Pseudomonas taetrolens TaxID=47884 RepID=UPI0030DCED6A
MLFTIVGREHSIPSGGVNKAFLHEDRWDDWGKYRTQFYLYVFDSSGKRHDVGSVKIGSAGLKPGKAVSPNVRAPVLMPQFDELPVGFFSVGQNETYYETLNLLDGELKSKILKGLRDIALDLDLLDQIQSEEVLNESLLRFVSLQNIRNRLNRLALGNAVLTKFEFEYAFPELELVPEENASLQFVVEPDSVPPTNVHVLIGRNGVGKTYCMQNMGRALLGDAGGLSPGTIRSLGLGLEEWAFAGLISVSFSAFDDFDLPESNNTSVFAKSIGLRHGDSSDDEPRIKTPRELALDFCLSFGQCRSGLRAERWRESVLTLYNDPVFSDADPLHLLSLNDEVWESVAQEFFHKKLSSGHKIVLLTITRLVELVDERTLVLLDEPEGHLHPPLLSAFVRSLANLLVKRNGVAIIATHSPVVLQEVPKSCVWMLRRSGRKSIAERPIVETFGENVGVLTRAVFGLEVTSAGFHQLIRDAVFVKMLSFDKIVEFFGKQLGGEALAIARALTMVRDSGAHNEKD